jgi:hypothetical protein
MEVQLLTYKEAAKVLGIKVESAGFPSGPSVCTPRSKA